MALDPDFGTFGYGPYGAGLFGRGGGDVPDVEGVEAQQQEAQARADIQIEVG